MAKTSNVVLASRDIEKLNQISDQINNDGGTGRVRDVVLCGVSERLLFALACLVTMLTKLL